MAPSFPSFQRHRPTFSNKSNIFSRKKLYKKRSKKKTLNKFSFFVLLFVIILGKSPKISRSPHLPPNLSRFVFHTFLRRIPQNRRSQKNKSDQNSGMQYGGGGGSAYDSHWHDAVRKRQHASESFPTDSNFHSSPSVRCSRRWLLRQGA